MEKRAKAEAKRARRKQKQESDGNESPQTPAVEEDATDDSPQETSKGPTDE